MEVVASLSQGPTADAQCGLFTYKSVPVIFEPPCIISYYSSGTRILIRCSYRNLEVRQWARSILQLPCLFYRVLLQITLP